LIIRVLDIPTLLDTYALRRAGFGTVASIAVTSLRLSGKKIPNTLIGCGSELAMDGF